MYVCAYVCMHVWLWTGSEVMNCCVKRMYVCAYACMYVWLWKGSEGTNCRVRRCVYVCVCVLYVSMHQFSCVCTCMYTHVFRHAHMASWPVLCVHLSQLLRTFRDRHDISLPCANAKTRTFILANVQTFMIFPGPACSGCKVRNHAMRPCTFF